MRKKKKKQTKKEKTGPHNRSSCFKDVIKTQEKKRDRQRLPTSPDFKRKKAGLILSPLKF